MKVEGWISSGEAEGKPESVGWLGGWFDDGDRWADYLGHFGDDVHPYLEAIKDDVLASGRFINGGQHQAGARGVPLFEDGTVGMFSFRAWGDLMAAIATVKDGKDHHYMEFYY
jgi:hypothetical protein